MALLAVVNNRSIEFASPFVRDVAVTISQFTNIDSNKDGIITGNEYLAVGQTLVFNSLKYYSSINDVIADLRDLDSVERKELIAVFKEGFSLENDVVEALIEDTLSYLEDTVTKGVELGKRWADAVKPGEGEEEIAA